MLGATFCSLKSAPGVSSPTQDASVFTAAAVSLVNHRKGKLSLTKYFKALGAKESEVTTWLKEYPLLLEVSVEHTLHPLDEFLTSDAFAVAGLVGAFRLDLSSTIATIERAHYLHQCGLQDADLVRLCHVYPRFLQASIEGELAPVVDFMKNIGVEGKDFAKMIKMYPHTLAKLRKFQPTVVFLQSYGFTADHIRRVVVKWPRIFTQSIEASIRPTIEWFISTANVPRHSIAEVIASFPSVLGYNIENNIQPKFDYVTQVMGFPPSVVASHPRVFSYSLLKLIIPRYEFLVSKGIELRSIRNLTNFSDKTFATAIAHSTYAEYVLFRESRGLVLDPVVNTKAAGGLRPSDIQQLFGVQGIDALQFVMKSPNLALRSIETVQGFIDYMGQLGFDLIMLRALVLKEPSWLSMSVERHLKPRVQLLKTFALSDKDIVTVLSKSSPRWLTKNIHSDLIPKIQFLLNDMKRPISELLTFPQYLCYKYTTRIRPRWLFLEQSQFRPDRNTLRLSTILVPADKTFTEQVALASHADYKAFRLSMTQEDEHVAI